MEPGNLVTITRKSIGVPAGTIGLITDCIDATFARHTSMTYLVKVCVNGKVRGRRYLGCDLEKIA